MSRDGRHSRHGIDRHDLELVSRPSRSPDDPEETEAVEEPEAYGLRINWQSEAVRIEAAEFLVATRIEHEARVRAAHQQDRLLHPDHS